MTTTPTLYVEATTRTTLDSWGQRVQIVDQRPANHDELIAAMPRCGTCDRWAKEGLNDASPNAINTGFCARYGVRKREDFGCTEHKEKP